MTADDRDGIPPELHDALDTIKAALPYDDATDAEAIAWAVKAHAACIADRKIVLSLDTLLELVRVNCEIAVGGPVREVDLGGGAIGFVPADAPDPPRAPIH